MRPRISIIGCVRLLVGLLVGNAFVRRSTRRTLSAYLALFFLFGCVCFSFFRVVLFARIHICNISFLITFYFPFLPARFTTPSGAHNVTAFFACLFLSFWHFLSPCLSFYLCLLLFARLAVCLSV